MQIWINKSLKQLRWTLCRHVGRWIEDPGVMPELPGNGPGPDGIGDSKECVTRPPGHQRIFYPDWPWRHEVKPSFQEQYTSLSPLAVFVVVFRSDFRSPSASCSLRVSATYNIALSTVWRLWVIWGYAKSIQWILMWKPHFFVPHRESPMDFMSLSIGVEKSLDYSFPVHPGVDHSFISGHKNRSGNITNWPTRVWK